MYIWPKTLHPYYNVHVFPMSIFTAFIHGFRLLRHHLYSVWIIYLSTLVLALIFILPFQSVLVDEIGRSLEITSMLKEYHHTVVADFLNVAGKQVNALLGQLKWLLLVYVLASVFFSAGLMAVFERNQRGGAAFIQGGLTYFWRFLRLTAYVWSLQIVIALLLYAPFLSQAIQGLDSIQNEISFFRLAFIGMLVHFPLAIFIFSVADFTKAHIVFHQEKIVLKAFWRVIKLFRTFFLQTYPLYVLNGLLIAGIYGIYLLLTEWIGMSLGHTIIIVFIIQQLVPVSRA